MHYVNLFTSPDAVETSKKLGWDIVCSVAEYSRGLKKSEAEVLSGALISDSIRKNSRKALDSGADIIIAEGSGEKGGREASECWEVDLIVNLESVRERDRVNQRSSGLDHVMASYMAERNTGYCINLENILNTRGVRRAQTLGRIGQNIRLCRKYGVKTVFGTGRSDRWSARSPHDLILFARLLGMGDVEAKRTVTDNPMHFLRKSEARNDPDRMMKGLEVVRWGSGKPKPNRKYGWY
ncbi:MAG: hypothetical protein GF416_06930 [Candidatus Altiarchaeales archaeon]|nr:hypothetical protein [Candidatus Altiarchaeales archaeon]MBD3416846.1 hypothetical protein [Candidatus Altiarchaeales archaeon]